MKTIPNDKSVTAFLDSIDKDQKREDSYAILELMREITNEDPIMWGESIVGFGRYHYKYSNGKDAEWFLTGFSPRVQSLTLYIMSGFDEHNELLDQLGKHKIGKSCLYINKLTDIDLDVLTKIIRMSVDALTVGRLSPDLADSKGSS